MSIAQTHPTPGAAKTIIGEPEVVEDGGAVDALSIALADGVEHDPAWIALRDAATALHELQAADGSVPDADYRAASIRDFDRWAGSDQPDGAASTEGAFGVPDFLDSLVAFQPQLHRV